MSDKLTLIADLGTNAELLFGDRRGLLACSSPTGPAFEGGQISCGQRAASGAIERIRIDRRTLEPRLKVIGCDLCRTSPAFLRRPRRWRHWDLRFGRHRGDRRDVSYGVISRDGAMVGALAAKTRRVERAGRTFAYVLKEGEPRLAIDQADVRAVQLAKAALYAGAKLLIEKRGCGPPQRVTLVGAFGSQIDPVYAMALGLIPDCDPLRSTRAATRQAPARASRSSTFSRAPRSKRSCARSTRLKRRLTPNSRMNSSPLWPCHMRPTRSKTSPTRSNSRRVRSSTPRGGGAKDKSH